MNALPIGGEGTPGIGHVLGKWSRSLSGVGENGAVFASVLLSSFRGKIIVKVIVVSLSVVLMLQWKT